MANRFYEPLPRCYFCASAVEGELFVWGGDTSNFRGRKRELASTIDRFVPKVVYKPHQKVWDLLPTRGSSPPGLQHGACTTIGHCLYVYGGWGEGTKHGSLHQFNVLTRTWTQLSAHTIDGPRKKTGFGMVSHGEKLVVFGGYCDDISVSTQPGASYDDGWTNELHTFDCKEGKWSPLIVTGTKPPPCSHFSFTKTDDHHAVLFGGYKRGPMQTYEDATQTNDVYILDLQRMHWSKLNHHKGEHPVERSLHAATCLGYGEGHPQLLLTGGWDDNKPLSDMWMLDLQSGRWTEVPLLEEYRKQRCIHCAVALTLSPGLTEVVMFGGSTSSDILNYIPIADTTLLRFEKSVFTGEWVLIDITNNSQQRTRRVRERQELEERVQEAERRLLESMEETSQWRSGLLISEERVREAERRVTASDQQATVAERSLQEAVRRSSEYQERSAELERRLRLLETQWLVERREIQLTSQELGRGGWATVSVAMFRGVRVAAKSIHRQIVSQHNIRLFQREMNMAARIRHPNLVQFIGATREGEMIILTELMPTSLRRELEREYMSPNLVKFIGLDVSRALNYLHLMQPDPIIHRDISSANVLLEPLPVLSPNLVRWRAKVTDYGSVNLLQRLGTACPGNPTYAAPEASDPHLQSPKMDIFSFGALLIEMLTGELPSSDERGRLLTMIHHQQLLSLTQRCLSERVEERPNASDIIAELDRDN